MTANYFVLPDAISRDCKCLKQRNKTLVYSLDVVDDAVQKIQMVSGTVGQTVQEKCEHILRDNT